MHSQTNATALASELEEAPLCNARHGGRDLRPCGQHTKLLATVKAAILVAACLVLLGVALARCGSVTVSKRDKIGQVPDVTLLEDVGASPSEFVTNAEGTKTFPWSEPARTVYAALYDAFGKEGVENHKGMAFDESHVPKRSWTEVAAWVDNELLKGPDPFKAHNGQVPVPWPSTGDGQDQLAPGQWVGYSRRQVCFIVAKSLLGAKTQGYNNGLQRYMEMPGTVPPNCLPRTNDFGKAWWSLLAACSADPGLRDGGQGPMLLATKAGGKPDVAAVRELSKKIELSSAGLRVCRYDDGSGGAGLPSGLQSVPQEGCAQPTASGPGKDFMTGGLHKQATQDISARFLGGYIFGNACGLGGGQDERLMVYLPEVSALTFFLSQAPGIANNQNPPQLRQPAWILGARKMLYGLDGTARFNEYEGFDAGVPLTSDLVDIQVSGKTYKISSSRPFLGFMSENQDFIPWADSNGQRIARRNKEPRQREVNPSSSYAFEKQVRAWYGSVALSSYNEDMQPILRKLVGSIGVGPWLAGLWWGDSQLGLLAVWLGHAIAAPTWKGGSLPLDYYMYSAFTENPGNQCFVHSAANCKACLQHCHAKPLPEKSYWLPKGVSPSPQDPCVDGDPNQDCGVKGIEDIYEAYAHETASTLWTDVETTLSANPQDVSRSVFDMLLA
mmetsp:Transcript_62269/g.181915  ORF Transcript_62269/g.181915 Transcript_62269/m.181915 type:complete len:670 (-) Transcript_62269:187-2196(-)